MGSLFLALNVHFGKFSKIFQKIFQNEEQSLNIGYLRWEVAKWGNHY